jgi:nucleotide-binding universal stress UspA family protein
VNQILVPLDGSALAEQALSCAVTLGQGLPAKVVLLRAVSIPNDVQRSLGEAGLEPGPLTERLENDASEYLEAVGYLLRETNLTFEYVVQRGPAADAIVDSAERLGSRLIVMATHGYTGLRRWRHGSVAERVLQAASVPVLLVRAHEPDVARAFRESMQCRRILVPLDGSELAEQVLPVVSPIARALESEIYLFRVPSVQFGSWAGGDWYVYLGDISETVDLEARSYLDDVARQLRAQKLEVSTATRLGGVAESIIEYGEVNRIDLIAMCTHGRTGLARWALGSVADRVLRAGNIPILLVRAT